MGSTPSWGSRPEAEGGKVSAVQGKDTVPRTHSNGKRD